MADNCSYNSIVDGRCLHKCYRGYVKDWPMEKMMGAHDRECKWVPVTLQEPYSMTFHERYPLFRDL